ncbi:hypothetical protein GGTG_00366 [Gaeumannomyces tritici R3-111a-1]|uniref:Uncharacterized protein n=1 Tax=Gaeumannomyces tritici (strain R3-111a-1) TaxID=644352 RepID=J3NGH6_GAET3|nr:hypothetical protein GGTG_00366 [Gaeumannomyces tritici R3-111a-1]EJT80366.1 hypothetical protein GGTG_00366 [Gaeumannomyces tritici R3-111a-1]
MESFGKKRSLSEPNSNFGSQSGTCRLWLVAMIGTRPGGNLHRGSGEVLMEERDRTRDGRSAFPKSQSPACAPS